MDKGGLIDAGSHDLITFEELGVPNWVIEEGLCPGLPNWEALKDPAWQQTLLQLTLMEKVVG